MNKTGRRAILAATGASAALWLAAMWASANDGDGWVVVAEAVLRLATILAAVAWVVLTVVHPMVETCRVWYQLGQAQQRRQCTCQQQPTARVIPLQRADRN